MRRDERAIVALLAVGSIGLVIGFVLLLLAGCTTDPPPAGTIPAWSTTAPGAFPVHQCVDNRHIDDVCLGA